MTQINCALPESEISEVIGHSLIVLDWNIQDNKRLNIYESIGIAVRKTDTDFQPLECFMFMQDTKSQIYYRQTICYDTHVISRDELKIIIHITPTRTALWSP